MKLNGDTDIDARGDKEEQLGKEVHRLLAVAENYPDLKANENFLNLQNELVATEDYLQFARRFYNGSVRQLNTHVETVPSNAVAGWFGFGQRGFFQKASDDVANVPLVDMGQIE
jgi:LemA protein